MGTDEWVPDSQDHQKNTSRKIIDLDQGVAAADDSLAAWTQRYLDLAVQGVRSDEVTGKITRHLNRFTGWLTEGLGHDRVSAVTPREVAAWRDHLAAEGNIGRRPGDSAGIGRRDDTAMAPATVNNHLAHLSALFSWITVHAPPGLLRHGDPTKKVEPLPLPAPQVRALAGPQVRTVKNVLDRIEGFHQLTGRRHRSGDTAPAVHRHARPLRDRAIVHLMLGTGLRRAEVVDLDLGQLDPAHPDELRRVKKAKLNGVRGKGRTSRNVFLGRDARHAIADYLQSERPGDVDEQTQALFLAASSIGARRPGGRLSPRSINTIVGEIGRIHDAETTDRQRHLGTLRPHDLRHTFGYRLSESSGHNRAELERRLGHANDRYLRLYTNPPDDIAAAYVEDL
ncbi:tyrosine-type recombinase/integrase [Streptosporangium sp. NPDC005286]|uniref:tyrosine-type recombinase/integrase n=1 Tax=Streptosporangium sp. NPDC005286 TaxID=3154463 RepID=UPI0033A98566